MKSEIHPTYFPSAKITCVCGSSYKIGSTMEEINVELCAHCHPFYTGKQKLVDTARRVEKFTERKAKATGTPRSKRAKLAVKKAKKTV